MKDKVFKQTFVDYITEKYFKPKNKTHKDYIKEIGNIFSSVGAQSKEEAQSVMDSFMYLSDIRKIKIETLRDSGKYDEALELLI